MWKSDWQRLLQSLNIIEVYITQYINNLEFALLILEKGEFLFTLSLSDGFSPSYQQITVLISSTSTNIEIALQW